MSKCEDKTRCEWANVSPEMMDYHDAEWGAQPCDDNAYFESLTLEIFEAGLSWELIFNRRDAFRKAFGDFDVAVIANYGTDEFDRLMDTSGIVRNRRKIEATADNARIFLEIQKENGGFEEWLNELTGDEEELIQNLRKRFKFVGPSVARSFLHDVGRTSAPHDEKCWKNKG